MSRLLVGRSLRGACLLMAAAALGCGIQREGEGADAVEPDATGSGGHGTAGTGGASGVAGVFGLGGASSHGGMSGSMGDGGSAGSAETGGEGGSGGTGGSGGNAGGSGNPMDASPPDGSDASIDALPKDASVTDVISDVAIDVGRDASSDTTLTDTGARDAEASVDAKPDACVAGTEVCDGLDNNCNGNVDEQNACPDGCIGITNLGKGYMFCYTQPRRATWPNAQADCVSRGMHLVRIDNAAENQWIVDTTTDIGYTAGLWIGANDRQTDGVWVWTDGVQFWQGESDAGGPIGGLYNDWAAGQPNNNDTGGEACAELELNGSWNWNDLRCDDFVRGYVCER